MHRNTERLFIVQCRKVYCYLRHVYNNKILTHTIFNTPVRKTIGKVFVKVIDLIK